MAVHSRPTDEGPPPDTPKKTNGSTHTEARSHEVKPNHHPGPPLWLCGFVEIPAPTRRPAATASRFTSPAARIPTCHFSPVPLYYPSATPRTNDKRVGARDDCSNVERSE